VGIDETIERRKGRKIKGKGLYHDAARSLPKQKIYTFGLQWISMMLIIKLPFSSRRWALPFLTVFTPSKQYNLKMGYRHKTVIDWTAQMIMQVSRWLPGRSGYLLGDGAYACLHLAQVCRRCGWHLISRLRLDARIYDFPAEDQSHSRGKKAKKGQRLPSLKQRANDLTANWQTATINWYANQSMPIQFQSEVCLWYRAALDPLPIRWVLVKDPQGKKEPQAFFTTDLNLSATTILELYLLRWNVEVTFEECRAHLGIETQRQWSPKAIQRTTPVLMALFSIVTLIATKMSKTDRIDPAKTIWYQKQQLTFSDLIIHVRYQIWRSIYNVTSTKSHKCVQLNLDTYETMLKQLAFAA
jgi:hypothetical protein